MGSSPRGEDTDKLSGEDLAAELGSTLRRKRRGGHDDNHEEHEGRGEDMIAAAGGRDVGGDKDDDIPGAGSTTLSSTFSHGYNQEQSTPILTRVGTNPESGASDSSTSLFLRSLSPARSGNSLLFSALHHQRNGMSPSLVSNGTQQQAHIGNTALDSRGALNSSSTAGISLTRPPQPQGGVVAGGSILDATSNSSRPPHEDESQLLLAALAAQQVDDARRYHHMKQQLLSTILGGQDSMLSRRHDALHEAQAAVPLGGLEDRGGAEETTVGRLLGLYPGESIQQRLQIYNAVSLLNGGGLLGGGGLYAGLGNSSVSPLQQQAAPSFTIADKLLLAAAMAGSNTAVPPSLSNPSESTIPGAGAMHLPELSTLRSKEMEQGIVASHESRGTTLQTASTTLSRSALDRSSMKRGDLGTDVDRKPAGVNWNVKKLNPADTTTGKIVATDGNVTSNHAMILFLEGDEKYLTEYQCLLRKQLEVFEAAPEDLRGSTQGRNTPIKIGQVGLRCRHCSNLPLAARTKGAVYFSQTIDGIYQIAQNMSKVHLCQRCYRIPADIQKKLIALKKDARRATGGKEYWGKALRAMGVYEDGTLLRMRKQEDNS